MYSPNRLAYNHLSYPRDAKTDAISPSGIRCCARWKRLQIRLLILSLILRISLACSFAYQLGAKTGNGTLGDACTPGERWGAGVGGGRVRAAEGSAAQQLRIHEVIISYPTQKAALPRGHYIIHRLICLTHYWFCGSLENYIMNAKKNLIINIGEGTRALSWGREVSNFT